MLLAAATLFVAVATGAFGAHALKARLGPEAMTIWQTAVQYHFWHALGLLAVGVLLVHRPDSGALGIAPCCSSPAWCSSREASTRSR